MSPSLPPRNASPIRFARVPVMDLRRVIPAFVLACGSIPSSPNPLLACATLVGPHDRTVPVLTERVLIIWEASSSTEHFFRRIAFDEAKQELGFIVPLPSAPEISEADSSVFDRLEKKVEPSELNIPIPISLIGKMLTTALGRFSQMITGAANVIGPEPMDPHSVRVISTTRLPGQTAVVLEANDAKALSLWLQTNGFVSRRDLTPWLQKYIAARWKLVAFKFDPHSTVPRQFTTPAVRLSFKTDHPFFPYREPSDEWSAAATAGRARLLKVFFIGTRRMVGSLGEARAEWPGKTVYSFPVFSVPDLLRGVITTTPSRRLSWLTVFEDRSSPRPAAEDLYFDVGHPFVPVIPTPKIKWFPVPIPIEFFLSAAFLYLTRQRAKTQ